MPRPPGAQNATARTMQDQRSLRHQLHADEFDEAELRALISRHFGYGVSVATDEVRYSSIQGGESTLVLTYDRGGGLRDVAAGPTLDESLLRQLVETITSELRVTGTELAHAVLFAAVPTRSQWRFANDVAIVPVPPGSPQPQEVLGDHPFILEVRHRKCVSLHLRVVRARRVLRMWELLLCVLVGWRIHSLGPYVTKRWVLVDSQGDLRELRPEFLQVGYFLPGYRSPEAEFGDAGAPSMPSVPDDQFYERRGISNEDAMSVPNGLPRALQRYTSLPFDEQRRFLRSCYWFQLSERQWELSESASYQSLVQAIEALLPRPSAEGTCVACNRPLEGPTRAFKDFIEKYAAWTTRAERDNFYAIRSSVVHGSALFLSDSESDFGGINPLRWQQREVHWRMAKVARSALVNYLLNT